MIYLVIIYHHALLHRISRKPVKSFHRSELHHDYNIDNNDNEDKKIIMTSEKVETILQRKFQDQIRLQNFHADDHHYYHYLSSFSSWSLLSSFMMMMRGGGRLATIKRPFLLLILETERKTSQKRAVKIYYELNLVVFCCKDRSLPKQEKALNWGQGR